MEHQPLVSVIMPCYNMEQFVSESIHSVTKQTYTNWELLIVDDASTDGTVEKVENICRQEKRIRLEVMPKHSGIAYSRNRCISMAKGQFLAFLDSDDVWHPNKLEQQLNFMTENHVGFSYSSYNCIDEESNDLGKTIKSAGNLDYESYLRNTIIGCSTVMVDTDIVGQVTVPNFRTSEDTATWLDILKKGHLAYAIEEPLVSYRIRRKSASSNKIKASFDLWTVYRRHEKIPFFKAIGYFASYASNAIKKRL